MLRVDWRGGWDALLHSFLLFPTLLHLACLGLLVCTDVNSVMVH